MRIAIITILSALSFACFGQFYPLEVGGVGGVSSGLNFRAYLSEDISYEALLSFRDEGMQVHLLRQEHHEIDMLLSGSLFLVYGYGAHTGFYYTDSYKIFFQDVYYGQRIFTPVVGADGFAGLEFRFEEYPLSIGVNYKPYMEISLKQIFGANFWDFGFTIKYRFKPDSVYY